MGVAVGEEVGVRDGMDVGEVGVSVADTDVGVGVSVAGSGVGVTTTICGVDVTMTTRAVGVGAGVWVLVGAAVSDGAGVSMLWVTRASAGVVCVAPASFSLGPS